MLEIKECGSWAKYYLEMTQFISNKSKDPSTKVGAVIVDEKQRVLSQGYNGFPRKVSDKGTSREVKLLRTIHAELNAILFARCDLTDATIYVSAPCCAQCMAAIIQVGIIKVVCLTPKNAFAGRWELSVDQGIAMAREVGIDYHVIRREHL